MRRGGSQVVAPGLLAMLSPITQLAYVPVSVALGGELGLSGAEIGVTVGIHSLATAVGNLVFGPVLDLVPVRRILPAALAVNALIALTLWSQQSYELLVLGRLGTGLTSSIILLCAYVLVADAGIDSDGSRDRGLSWMQTFQSIGAALGLGLGAALAGLGAATRLFPILALYAMVAMVVSLALLPRRAVAVAREHVPLPAMLRAMADLVTHRRMQWIMLGSFVLGLVIQGSHFGVSALLEEREVNGPLGRAAVAMVIPLGVFSGSATNRLLLRSWNRLELYPRVYSVLPVAALLYAASIAASGWLGVVVLPLWALGFVLGGTMPLGVALGVGWYPTLRGTATAAESFSRQVGSTVGPIMVGTVSAVASLPAAASFVAVVAVVGVSAAWAASRAGRPVAAALS